MLPPWVAALTPSEPQGSSSLAGERAKSTIDTDQIARFFYPEGYLERQERLLQILEADPAFEKTSNYYDGRTERWKKALVRAKRIAALQIQHKWTDDELWAALELLGEAVPYALHWGMFITTLRDQGTPEQHDLFLQKALNFEIIGCYAQTELGHGSNVQGLETRATWCPHDKTFVLNSPFLTASKWWIGTLGRTANYAVVMAQLVIEGRSYGPHPFICPLRDLTSHQPLEGVYVGDIGPKMGYNTMDNGFLLLHNVKIPHVNMLARFSRVDPDTSRYIKPAAPGLVYGTVTYARMRVAADAARGLARGTTIAIRYSAVRRQFRARDPQTSQPLPEGPEMQVLDYTTVHARLLPLVAATFALQFTGTAMQTLYRLAKESLPGQGGSLSETPKEKDLFAEMHSTSCVLKVFASITAAEGLETARRACGGHGYSLFSGIGSWYAEYLPTMTFDGDNYILSSQGSRYLINAARSVLRGNALPGFTVDNLQAFRRPGGATVNYDLDNDQDIVSIFGRRAAFYTFQILEQIDEKHTAHNELLPDYWRLCRAHAEFLAVHHFSVELKNPRTNTQLGPQSANVLWDLFRLFATDLITKEPQGFYVSGTLTVAQVEDLSRNNLPLLLKRIRPHAVRLVDSWKLPDWLLDSSLGRYDGQVYPDLFRRASELNPLNKVDINPYPFTDRKRDRPPVEAEPTHKHSRGKL
ncbi:hypothetical protein Z517_11532 [Fonsecaea pedrosoi CBS 271.37]|uniref:Acyl-coenzyme A oxidase n=1 Tax=Fonsecaea pedrosoi CBS 271.37 TaxID=1442368 RepID=A0A0D2EK22_9EURO|nr:uncharacterized protein Z517_11532 [Fonsecaea pedrosoi CBS 271.37]KIW74762.1 hypothetical protein Z517_11532 [Fonsecaea pedrosoi CBS 271.37]